MVEQNVCYFSQVCVELHSYMVYANGSHIQLLPLMKAKVGQVEKLK